jgi:hypothetical protein
MPVSRAGLPLAQMDEVYDRLRGRLEGLTDDEYLWEPVPGCWSVHRDPPGAWVTDYAERWPACPILWMMTDHDAHHGAEIGCLPDLYRATSAGGWAPVGHGAAAGQNGGVSGEPRIGVLGPLEVRAGSGHRVEVAGARLRRLLLRLALEPGRVVTSGQLVDAVSEERPPAEAANALQALVSRLRRLLPGVVESPPPATGWPWPPRRSTPSASRPWPWPAGSSWAATRAGPGPSTATTVPVRAARSTPPRAVVSPKRLTRPCASMVVSMDAPLLGCREQPGRGR